MSNVNQENTAPAQSTGDVIGQDIAAAGDVITPFISSMNPAIGAGVGLALKLLSVAEPAVYNAIVVVLGGGQLTAEQVAARDAAIGRLQNPAQYFA